MHEVRDVAGEDGSAPLVLQAKHSIGPPDLPQDMLPQQDMGQLVKNSQNLKLHSGWTLNKVRQFSAQAHACSVGPATGMPGAACSRAGSRDHVQARGFP